MVAMFQSDSGMEELTMVLSSFRPEKEGTAEALEDRGMAARMAVYGAQQPGINAMVFASLKFRPIVGIKAELPEHKWCSTAQAVHLSQNVYTSPSTTHIIAIARRMR